MKAMRIPGLLATAALLAGCGEDSVAPAGSTGFTDDFSQDNASRWSASAGSWIVTDGRYVGFGGVAQACQGFGPNQSLVQGLQASDLEVELDMVSLSGVDKGLILRSSGASDQIELDFRAERPGAYPADLIVQEQVNCNRVMHTAEFAVLVPHQVGQTIRVRVRLIATQLTVWVDGAQVLDASFPFTNVSGKVGVAFLTGGTTAFDNVRIPVLGT